ncbi:MAG TPA: hypothetical protein VG345_05640 [Bryobacteraceae bacterium]|nr:hypothetical protein [Bryobacteraceae bacterium]
MQISQASNTTAVYNSQPAQTPAKNSAASQTPTDTVQLSPAAQAKISGGGDVDHDGDAH